MTVDPPGPSERPRRWWGVLRVALLVMWLVAAAASWWSAPRQASYDEATSAVADKRLTAYQWGDSWGSNRPRSWFAGPALRSTGTKGTIFAWRTGDGRVRWVDTDGYEQVSLTGVVDEDSYSGPGAVGIAEALVAAGIPGRTGAVGTRRPWIVGVGVVLTLAFLGGVVAGPAPVLGTRWYWFWLISTAPQGLGLVYWLVRERPWSRTAQPARKAAGGTRSADPRDHGWLGLLTGVLVSGLFIAFVIALNSLLGERWVPWVSGW